MRLGGETIAETNQAIRVDEDRYPPRYYLPQSDIKAGTLTASAHSTHCPFKGDASYWSVTGADGQTHENAAWAYRDPFDECLALKDMIAFYGDAFEIVEL